MKTDWNGNEVGTAAFMENNPILKGMLTQLAALLRSMEEVKGEVECRLWDTQWMNIVNHENCYRDFDKSDAIADAVRRTEDAMARNFRDDKWRGKCTSCHPPAESGEANRASRHCQCEACMVTHASDCAVHSEPAMPKGPCNCGALPALREIDWEDQRDDIAWSNGWNAYARAIISYPKALKAAMTAESREN